MADPHATPDRAATSLARSAAFIEENREWLRDWRDGQFDSSSRDKDGWPIEMHGLALALEEAMEMIEDIYAQKGREHG